MCLFDMIVKFQYVQKEMRIWICLLLFSFTFSIDAQVLQQSEQTYPREWKDWHKQQRFAIAETVEVDNVEQIEFYDRQESDKRILLTLLLFSAVLLVAIIKHNPAVFSSTLVILTNFNLAQQMYRNGDYRRGIGETLLLHLYSFQVWLGFLLVLKESSFLSLDYETGVVATGTGVILSLIHI